MQFYLAPYEWVTEGQSGYWSPPWPNRVRGSLDLRSIPARSTAVTPQGYGLFAYLNPQVIANSIDLGDSVLGISNKAAAELAVGEFTANSVRGMAIELLTVRSDPTGQSGPLPLMPNHLRRLHLIFGGEDIDLGDMDVDHPAFGKVLAVLREQYRRIRAHDLANDSNHYLRVLGALKRKYRVANAGIFIPDDLPQEEELPPETTLGDTFDRSDDTNLNASNTGKTLNGSAGTWSWTEVANDSNIGTNSLRNVTTGVECYVRAEQDLSSDDHFVEGSVTATSSATTTRVFLLARFDSGATTCYAFRVRQGDVSLYSIVAGVQTQIANLTVATNAATAETAKLTVNGSAIEGFIAGVSQVSTTDTSITGNLRIGAATLGASAGRGRINSITAEDISALTHYTLTAEQASFALIGQVAGLLATRRITADQSAFALTGQDATLRATRLLALTHGAFTLNGQDAFFAAGDFLDADVGSFALTGQDAGLTLTRLLVAVVGSFTLTGRAATLTVDQVGDDVFVTPLERTLIVNADVRVYAVPYENRTILVNQEI
jgi:hypothetical protein